MRPGWLPEALPSTPNRQAAESGSFLKKRTKKLCEFGFGLSWRTEAEIIKSFLLLFFKKEVLSCLALRRGTAPTPALPQSGGGSS
jgi:hypothetical protein